MDNQLDALHQKVEVPRSRKRVIIISGPWEGQQLHEGFLKLGYDSYLFIYSHPDYVLFRPRWGQKLYRQAFPHRFLNRAFNQTLREAALPFAKQLDPDFLVIYKGHLLDPDNREALAKLKRPIAFWANDSMVRFPSQRAVAEIASFRFYIDGGDVKDERDLWLPVGYDPSNYNALQAGFSYDLSFIGRLTTRNYSKRRSYLLKLSESDFPKRFNCISVCSTGNRWAQLKLNRKLTFTNLRSLPYHEFMRVVASGSICINIHQDDGIKSVNPMFFGIPGLGVCQVAEDRDYLAQWLEPWVEYIPVNDSNFLDTLSHIAENKELQKKVAESGRRRVENAHTFYHRAETIAKCMSRL